MAFDPKNYPADWEARTLALKAAAGYRCQRCGQTCRRPGESVEEFCARITLAAWEDDAEGLALHVIDEICADAEAYPQRYVLTVAHYPNPDPMDCRAENLHVLCSGCHNRLDAPMRASNRRKNRLLKNGQLLLESVS